MSEFRVDSFKFLTPDSRRRHEAFVPEGVDEMVAAKATVPLAQARVALLTSSGIYLKGAQQPFDVEREKREPWWGDPTYRVIPRDLRQGLVGASHLHVRADDIYEDFNVALPLRAFGEFERAGEIGSLADHHYSFMGFQEEPYQTWRDHYGPELGMRLRREGVHCLVLAPV